MSAIPSDGGAGTARGFLPLPRLVGSPEPKPGTGPAPQPILDRSVSTEGPLRSYLELAALPGAVPCARLHAKQVIWEWQLSALAKDVELVVSELVTNAVRASGGLEPVGLRRRSVLTPTVRLWLAASQGQVLVQVWDGNGQPPRRRSADLEGESGRGLLLVETLSTEWSWFAPDGWPGKVVWAVVE